jgi:O-acetyl-ADP-ribose deacetylase (regulator of RNase III)
VRRRRQPCQQLRVYGWRIDLLYSRHFGWHVQERLQRLIVQRHHGELLVGTAEIVETDDSRIPYLISAPTMRVPMVLHNSVNPYLACRATLLLVKHGVFSAGSRKGEPVAFHVKSIAFHGLGTGVGSPHIFARVKHALP